MSKHYVIAMLGVALVAATAGLTTSTASASTPRPAVVVHDSDREVIEGDRMLLTAKVPAPSVANRVVLERLKMPVYEGIGSAAWEVVRSAKVRGRSRIKFTAVARQPDIEKLRIRVLYKDRRRPSLSLPVSLKVWSWVPLREISSYYESIGSGLSEAGIAGRTYAAWGGFIWSPSRSWERRVTPGRNCKAFRGVAGLTDVSPDGSTGTVSLIADEQPQWTSPSLSPGAAVPFEIPLALPYRVTLLATNSSPESVRATPTVGDPEFLCSGL